MPSRIHQLKTLFSQRLQWMQQHHYADRTLKTHQESLHIFSRWCYQHHILACHDLNNELLLRYKQWLSQQCSRQHKPWSLHYQRVLLSVIKRCLIWAFNRGDLLINPVKHLKLPIPDKTIINVLNLSQLQALLLAPDLSSPHGIRDRALLEVFYATALRRQEVLQLIPQDLDRKQGLVWVQSGKGKKERKVPIAKSSLDWVAFYETKVRNEWLERGDHQNKLFINHRGRPISLGNCSERIKRYLKQIAPNHSGSCHLIRHSVATLLLENGCHIRFIQELLGHASLSSTECYAQVRVPHLSQSYAKYHPSMK